MAPITTKLTEFKRSLEGKSPDELKKELKSIKNKLEESLEKGYMREVHDLQLKINIIKIKLKPRYERIIEEPETKKTDLLKEINNLPDKIDKKPLLIWANQATNKLKKNKTSFHDLLDIITINNNRLKVITSGSS